MALGERLELLGGWTNTSQQKSVVDFFVDFGVCGRSLSRINTIPALISGTFCTLKNFITDLISQSVGDEIRIDIFARNNDINVNYLKLQALHTIATPTIYLDCAFLFRDFCSAISLRCRKLNF